MRIAIVNDMVIAVEAIRRVLLTVADYQVAWVARDGAEAVAKAKSDPPDLILMDLVMPGMDGVEATREIMRHAPCAILIVTADVKQRTGMVFEAMGYGALDAVNTPILGSQRNPEVAQGLLRKIATVSKLIRSTRPAAQPVPPPLRSKAAIALPPLVAIGASTGGPKALATILAPLPAHFGAAIVIVQHVDAQFAEGFIDWLDHQTALPVRRAKVGDRPTPGTVLVACTNDHLCLQPNHTLTYVQNPLSYPYRPSIDVFFKSLVQYWSAKGTAILLTGMGRDGAEGLKLLRKQGWHTIAQDQPSCIVYGMPKAAVELDAAVELLNPDAIAKLLLHRLTFHSHE